MKPIKTINKLSLLVTTFALLSFSYFLGCGSSQSSINAIEKKKDRAALCGVELYKAREDRICGEIYNKGATAACGVHKYNSRAHISCPGSIRRDEYDIGWGFKEHGECKDGYELRDVERVYKSRQNRMTGDFEKVHVGFKGMCVRDEHLESCRKPEFGVETYKTCRHPSHGLNSFETCRRPEFGVELYKECEYYKTPEDAIAYAELVRTDAPMMAAHLFIHKGNYFANTRNELALSCHIAKYDGDALYKEVVHDLKLKFQAINGKPYRSNDDACVNVIEKENPLEISCDDDDKSPRCQSIFGYKAAWTWFSDNIKDLGLIIQDLKEHNLSEKNALMIEVKANLEKVFDKETVKEVVKQ